jgi:hypothetical protein
VVHVHAHSNHSQNEGHPPRHCATPRNYGLIAQFEEGTQIARKLHATCIVRLADISFMYNTSVIIFEFRVMTV